MTNKIILPRTNDEGKPRISYSQISSWKEEKAFNQIYGIDGNLKEISGTTGYILKYFLNYDFPPSPMDVYAPFGIKVEDYICNGIKSDLDDAEIAILDTIIPIGQFQEKVEVDFGDFVIEGFLDDCNEDRSWIRDYKSASKNSAKKYEKDTYFQLDLYALEYYKKYKRIPEKMEVVVIERGGSHFKPPLKTIGTFTIPKTTSVNKLQILELEVRGVVQEISDTYKLFLELNKLT